jgi:hypothetical protein
VSNNNYSPKQYYCGVGTKKFTINAEGYKITKKGTLNIYVLCTEVHLLIKRFDFRRKLFEINVIPFRTEIC